jgi:nucleoside-diphosphate-sugar epimerase
MRDFTYVDDVAEATINAIEFSEPLGEIINVGSNTPVRLIDTIKMMADIIGIEPKYRLNEELKGDVKYTYADISKAERLLKWKPMTPIREGLEKEIAWIKHVTNLSLL